MAGHYKKMEIVEIKDSNLLTKEESKDSKCQKGMDIALLKKRLSHWLDTKSGLKSYSCMGFSYFITTGVDFPPVKQWNVFFSDTPTDLIRLTSSVNPKDFHQAIRLPKDVRVEGISGNVESLYLSQFGNGGIVVVSTLKVVNSFFETDTMQYVKSMRPSD
jgi:hypothetical protein